MTYHRETERETLERYLAWLQNDVLSGYQRRGDGESCRQTKKQIDDIRYRLEPDPPRPRPECEWSKPLREHPAPNCADDYKITVQGRIHGKHCFRPLGIRDSEPSTVETT